jgi:hypothetical protein
MEKEQRSKSQSDKDDLHPEYGTVGIDTADHDEFAHIPGGKREDKTGEELMSDVFRSTGKYNQTKDDIHGKGQSSG